MAVAVELQAEGRPRRDPQIAEAELRVEEVEVVVEALGVFGAEEGLARLLVVPRLEGRAGFHGGEDMDQTGRVAPLPEDLPEAVVLAEGLRRADELDLQPRFLGEALGILPDLVPERLGKARQVKQLDVV